MLVLQMHGEPGSGKSTLARALAAALNATVLDKDVIKAALLRAGAPEALAAPASYEAFFALGAHLLRQGRSVILDSPAFWPEVEVNSRRIAGEAGAAWLMIECVCPDRQERTRRLATREALASQPRAPLGRTSTAEPACARLTLDTTRPLDEIVAAAVTYVRDGVPA